MAIKGKTKKRGGGAKRAAVAPKPIIVERKPPFLMRKPVKRAILGVLVVAAVLGGLRVWQNLSRSNSLKVYDRKLTRAEGQLNVHLDASSASSMVKNASDFGAGKVGATQFQTLAKTWENDFTLAKAAVEKLKGPGQLGDTQQLISQAIDEYVGVARLYQAAALQQLMADATSAKAKAQKDAAFKKILEDRAKAEKDQVQVILLHAQEARSRAEAVMQIATAKLDALKKEWGVAKPAVPSDVGANLNVPQQ